MKANHSVTSLRANVSVTRLPAARCLLLIAIWALLGCAGGYHNPMVTSAPASTPTPNPPMPMHHKK